MFSDTSYTSSFQLRLAVTILISISTICILIATSTNQWVKGNGKEDVQSIGIWKVCLTQLCIAHTDIIYAKVLIVFALLFGIFGNVIAVLAMVYGMTDLKRMIAKTMFGTATLSIGAVASATAFLVLIPWFSHISYGLIFGWVATILYFVAGCISYYHHTIEPDRNMTIDEITQFATSSNTHPPPYTEQQPSSVAVS